jgi:hypothetical protein
MKSFSKRLLARLARHDRVWRLLDRLVLRAARFAEYERQDVLFRRQVDAVVRATFPDLTVRHGPFRGLRYPSADAVCSQVLPKLLGSYERELHLAVERACRNAPPVVIDVGSAEGFYAVGLARRLPGATVHAFDTAAVARDLCRAMAAANGVADRVAVGGWCGPDELRDLVAGRPALVVCDCEGYELDLLTPDVLPALARAELIVEAHDFTGVEIAAPLADRFRPTHEVTFVTGTDDDAKVRFYDYPELAGYDRPTRKFIVAERRPAVMEWLVLTPRAGGPQR